ncbi:MAG: adenylate kinase [Actinomycetota bacterium]
MQRLSVIGTSGVGKTSLAKRLASRLDLRHIEVDGIFHQANWTPLDDATFRSEMKERCAEERWVTDANYSVVRDLILDRADTVVWLDYSRVVTTGRVLRRTLRRAITHEELWNGNREPLSGLFRWDPEQSILRWSWTSYALKRAQYSSDLENGRFGGAEVLRFRTPSETERWLDTLPNPDRI